MLQSGSEREPSITLVELFEDRERGIEMVMKEYSVKMSGGRNVWLSTYDGKTMRSSDEGKTVANQLTLQEFESMPEISTIYNIDVKVSFGRIGLKLNDMAEQIYSSGSVIGIPARTKIVFLNQFAGKSTVFLVRK